MQQGSGGNDFDKVIYDLKNAFGKGGKKGFGNNGGSGNSSGGDFNIFNNFSYIIIAALIALAAILVNASYYKVDEGGETVVLRFGRYLKTTLPGLHFKIPFVDQVRPLLTKERKPLGFGYNLPDERRQVTTVFGTRRVKRRVPSEESLMVTGDLNIVYVEWTVQYEIKDPVKYLFQARDIEKNIRDVSMSVLRKVVGDDLVSDVLTTGKIQIQTEAQDLMQAKLDEYDLGVSIAEVILGKVEPPKDVRASFDEVNEAKQEQEQSINDAEKDYNRIIPEARGLAEQQIAEAQAYAVRLVNRAKGDAEAFTEVLQAYKKAPEITRSRLYIETMEKVYSESRDLMIVDSGIKGLLPVYGPQPMPKVARIGGAQ